MNDMQIVQFYDKYSRWIDDEGRFETFEEAVDRSIRHAKYVTKGKLSNFDYEELRLGMLNQEAFPSMRWFQMAGPAAERHPQSIFNCSYLKIDSMQAFGEVLFLLGLGVGVGYSVEEENVSKLPIVNQGIMSSEETIIVEDSLEGWFNAFNEAIAAFYNGFTVTLDVSKVRPAGTRLKTRGGVASGPGPFVAAIAQIQDIFISAAGRKLRPIEVHDILCFIAACIVSGGVRRSAMISLFDIDDNEMLTCKSPENISGNEQRYYANNSAVIASNDSLENKVIDELTDMIFKNGNGEPGIFNRIAANNTSPLRRTKGDFIEFGTNPCGEVFLHNMQFCNLSIANVRPNDDLKSLVRKVSLATMWGTIQASVDDFVGLRKNWSSNQRAERLLGVDLNGVMDNQMFWPYAEMKEEILSLLRQHAINVNKDYAEKLGINPAAAITCNKPAGNSSVFFDTASGIHPRFSRWYIRRMTLSVNSSIAQFLMMKGFECEPTNGVSWSAAQTAVFEFYVDASASFTSENIDTRVMLDHWIEMQNWTEHNSSSTVYYEQGTVDEDDIKSFLMNGKNFVAGITFLPKFENVWAQAPYERLTKQEYDQKISKYPKINWDEFFQFHQQYKGIVGQEFACVAGSCEL